jgi:2-iminobutanoate/2-iminopropanoate deaminase
MQARVTCNKPWEAGVLFSLGAKVSGELLLTAGITARDPEGRVVGAGDMRAQMTQCFRNLEDVLRASGADWDDVAKVLIYVTDFAAFAKTEDIRRQYLRSRPAATAIAVSALIDPAMMVEIEAIAVLGGSP